MSRLPASLGYEVTNETINALLAQAAEQVDSLDFHVGFHAPGCPGVPPPTHACTHTKTRTPRPAQTDRQTPLCAE